jgi:hypothetical protein
MTIDIDAEASAGRISAEALPDAYASFLRESG